MTSFSIPTLKTERLLLRPPTPADLDGWAAVIFADPDVMRYMPTRDLTPVERAERAMNVGNRSWAERGHGLWLITDKISDQIIGHCALEYLEEAGEVEIGYALGKAYWGKGIATEAGLAALRFGFEIVSLPRIIAVAIPENVASRGVMENLGMTYEKDVRFWDLDLAFYAVRRDRFVPSEGPFRLLEG